MSTMADSEAMTTTAAQLEGRRRLATLRHRAHRIRVWVSCVAVVTFLALFSGIYAQMSSGADPALGSGATAVASSTQSTVSAAASTASTASAAASTDTASSQQAAPMTTQQS